MEGSVGLKLMEGLGLNEGFWERLVVLSWERVLNVPHLPIDHTPYHLCSAELV